MSNQLNRLHSHTGSAAAPASAADVSAALRNRFAIEKKLCESEAHTVYLARDLNNPAAGPESAGLVRLKVLSGALARDSRQVELFRLEAAAAALLSHRNIPRTTEAEEVNGVHFCVTEERRDVNTLRDYLKIKGWLDAEEAVRIGLEIADALEHAHGHCLLHLTLDPEKVFIGRDGEVSVTGFGIGRGKHLLWARQERSRHCAERYITPEQILSGETDQRSDLYLLGIILFEMLTDRAPFESEDRAILRQKHLTGTPQPPHMFRQELSRDLSQVVMDLLSKRPDGRPFTAGILKHSLERCVASGLMAGEECPVWPPLPDVAPVEPLIAAGGVDVLDEMPPEEKQEDSYEPDLEYLYEPDLASGDVVAEAALEETREYGPEEEITGGPMFLVGESNNASLRRLAWAMVALVLCAGIIWAIHAASSQKAAVKSKISNPAAPLQSNDEPAASKAEVALPTPGSVTSGTAKETHNESKPATPALDNRDNRKETAAATQTEPRRSAAGEKLNPPRKPEIAPPALSAIGPVFSAANNPAAELSREMPGHSPPQETAPLPEASVKAEAPAPRIIRKPGDVLQNTAIIRPRPVYPRTARKADIKGMVTVEVTIDEEGSVIAARPISGPEQLRDVAVEAARRWKWTPARVDRSRARVVGTITFSFRD